MAKNFIQPGRVLSIAAPTGGVTTGVGVLIGSLFGVALQTAAAGVSVDLHTEGIWSLAKTSAQAWAIGDKIYWDNVNKRCDNALAAGFRFIGYATAAAANPSAVGTVRLAGGAATFEDDAAPAPASYSTAGPQTYTAADMLGGIIVRATNGARARTHCRRRRCSWRRSPACRSATWSARSS
jgi:predicted RecA/RadA family phage recombinase